MTAVLPEAIRPRVGQVVRLLASDKDGEVLAAVRALQRTLSAAGCDLNDLGDAIERSPRAAALPRSQPLPRAFAGCSEVSSSPYRLIEFLARHGRSPVLTSWESSFAASIVEMLSRPSWHLSARQAEITNRIIAKLAGATP